MSSTAATRLAPGYANVTLERDVECRLDDGVVLRADVYRPFVEGPAPGRRSPLYRAVGTARRDPVDNVRGSCLDRYLVSRTVRADA